MNQRQAIFSFSLFFLIVYGIYVMLNQRRENKKNWCTRRLHQIQIYHEKITCRRKKIYLYGIRIHFSIHSFCYLFQFILNRLCFRSLFYSLVNPMCFVLVLIICVPIYFPSWNECVCKLLLIIHSRVWNSFLFMWFNPRSTFVEIYQKRFNDGGSGGGDVGIHCTKIIILLPYHRSAASLPNIHTLLNLTLFLSPFSIPFHSRYSFFTIFWAQFFTSLSLSLHFSIWWDTFVIALIWFLDLAPFISIFLLLLNFFFANKSKKKTES